MSLFLVEVQGLFNMLLKNATVPVIETGAGICHLYVDQEASLDMALEIAKMQRSKDHLYVMQLKRFLFIKK